MRKEALALQQIARAYSSGERSPVPQYAEFVDMMPKSADEAPTSALLMEFIEGELLSRVYRTMTNMSMSLPADGQSYYLEGERLAWRAGRQYLAFLRKQFSEIKLISSDRKYDTFRWDSGASSSILEGKLIIIDWNQTTPVPHANAADSYAAVRLMMQNWYILLTGRDPLNFPPRLADDNWPAVSLGGRDILLQVFEQQAYFSTRSSTDLVLEEIDSRVASLLRLIEDPQFLRNQIERGDEIAADIGRRKQWYGRDDAQARYEEWLKTQQLSPQNGDSREDLLTMLDQMPALPNADAVAEYIAKLRASIVEFAHDAQVTTSDQKVVRGSLERLIRMIDEAISGLRTSHFDPAIVDKLNERIDRFRKDMEATLRSFDFETQFKDLAAFVRVYPACATIRQRLESGISPTDDLRDLRDELELVKPYFDASPGLRALFGMTVSLDDLTQWLKEQTRDYAPIGSLYQNFIDAVRMPRHQEAYRIGLNGLLTAVTSHRQAEIVHLYLEALESTNAFAAYQPYTRAQMFEKLHELGVFVEQFPELREWACDLRFVRTAVDIYHAEQTKTPHNPVLLLFMAGLLQRLAPARKAIT